jgi:hypothetical protein
MLDMFRQSKMLWIGVAMYIASFFLTAVTTSSGSAPGYHCTYITLAFSWDQFKLMAHGLPSPARPLEYVSFLISGWINLLFVAAAILAFSRQHQLPARILKNVIVVMIPFCWIVFFYESAYPREGYFIWTAAMLIVLFAGETREAKTVLSPESN